MYYFCDEVRGNQKLAYDEEGKTIIETRGRGGYAVAPPSPACCHRLNKPWVHILGPALTSIPRITVAERRILLDAAKTFNRSKKLSEAEQYIETAPLARSGHAGHNTTFGVASRLRDLGVPMEKARELMDRYNERLAEAGEETWKETELDHKVADAYRPSPEVGCNRIDDPHRLASNFIASRPWVFWHGRHFEYVGTKYVEVADYEVGALLTTHVRESLDMHRREQLRRGEETPRRLVATRSLVRNTQQAVEALCLLRNQFALPTLLPGTTSPSLLGFANGLLDLESCKLVEHTSNWFSLVCLPYAFDSAAECPRWLGVLHQNLEGDADRISLLQEFFGYTLMNTTDAQPCLFLVGEGSNGKSVVLAGLHAMLGADNVSTVPLEDFGERFAMAQTLGKLANIIPEVGELDRTAEGTLKAFVSGDRMTFEKKGKDPFSARPTARLVLSTNNMPRFSDKSQGVWRRLILMPFTRQVPAGERVAGMDKPEYWLKIEEAPGILNWALEGLRRLQKNGMRFTEAEVCRVALQEHRADSDPCRAFLEDHYVADSQGKPMIAAIVYSQYQHWCEENGFKAVNANNFSRQVKRIFAVEAKSQRSGSQVNKVWIGLGPRTLAA